MTTPLVSWRPPPKEARWQLTVARRERAGNRVKSAIIATETFGYFLDAEVRRDALWAAYPGCHITIRPLTPGWTTELGIPVARDEQGRMRPVE